MTPHRSRTPRRALPRSVVRCRVNGSALGDGMRGDDDRGGDSARRAVAVMRNRFASGDLTTAARIDRLVAEATS